MRRRLAFACLALLVAQAAAACPVCFDAEEEARVAYQVTAAGLSLLPLALMGAAILWVRRRLKQRELEPALPESA